MKYLDTKTLAKRLGVSRQRVASLVNAKKLPVIKLGGRTWRFHEDTVVDAMTVVAAESSRRKGTFRLW